MAGTDTHMDNLKLVALDADDLEILSTHLQDAVLRVGDMAYLAKEMRFVAIANRFDWSQATNANGKGLGKNQYERRRSALRFERVLAAQVQNISLDAKDVVLELLAIQYEAAEAPEAYISLVFAAGGMVRLHVECVEAELKDLGAVWRTSSKPSHPDDMPG